MKELYETYENCRHMVGVEDDDGFVLLPVAHSTQNAQIEIAINLRGDFLRAEEISKVDAVTIIPVTEDSGTRSSGIAPHPLCDKLVYVAGDYAAYCDKKRAEDYYAAYIKQLKDWCTSIHSNSKVEAVYHYVKKGSMISNLLACGILTLNSDGRIDDRKKIQNVVSSEAFVRFRIEDLGIIDEEEAVWRDKSIYQSYVDYIQSKQGKLDLCYVSGKMMPNTYKHPAKVRHAADKAKLISANDEQGFTYKGRFTDKELALSVGYLTSQEAHNALRWLIEKQGYKRHGLSILAWEKNEKKLPNILESTTNTFLNDDVMDSDMGYSYAMRLKRAIDGYRNELDTKARIHIISLDAATTGRLAVNYYHELNGSDFMERLINWHETCIWELGFKKNNRKEYILGTPSTEDIVFAAFGTEQNGILSVKDELVGATIQRLLPCILDKRNIPKDIVRAAVQNASRPTAMEPGNWRKVLSVACALVKKEKNYIVEDWNMALNNEERDRSYLYGRLLGVADRVEYLTYDKDEKRQTNAKRYMQQFKNRPYSTWVIIESNIRPYFDKLKSSSISQYLKYEHLLEDLYDMIDPKDYMDNRPLDGMYLLGFYCQAKAFRKNSKEENIEEVMDNE